MTWSELLESTVFGKEIIVTIINPVRKEEYYKSGTLHGYKAGILGGGHHRYKNGVPMRFESARIHWIKKPKVLVTYNVYNIYPGGKQHSEWIDVDNCTFEIKETTTT